MNILQLTAELIEVKQKLKKIKHLLRNVNLSEQEKEDLRFQLSVIEARAIELRKALENG